MPDPDALRAWLCTMPPGVLRLKGVLRTGDTDLDWSELQFAGRHGQLPCAALSALFDNPA